MEEILEKEIIKNMKKPRHCPKCKSSRLNNLVENHKINGFYCAKCGFINKEQENKDRVTYRTFGKE